MASREELAWAEVLRLLKADATLMAYVKNVYEGWRDSVPDSMFPCIYMEPEEAAEELYAVPNRYKITYRIHLIAEINCATSYDLQIIGDANVKGIVDIANDIKSALAAYPNLNGNCQKISFPNTRYSFATFPYRQVDITMNVELITTGATR
jgi:hypothetical protein